MSWGRRAWGIGLEWQNPEFSFRQVQVPSPVSGPEKIISSFHLPPDLAAHYFTLFHNNVIIPAIGNGCN